MRGVRDFLLRGRSQASAVNVTQVLITFLISFVFTVAAGMVLFPRAPRMPAHLSKRPLVVHDRVPPSRRADFGRPSPTRQRPAPSGERPAATGQRTAVPAQRAGGLQSGTVGSVGSDVVDAAAPRAARSKGTDRRPPVRVTAIAVWGAPRWPWVSITASGPVRYRVRDVEPNWVVLDVSNARLALVSGATPAGRGLVRQIRVGQFTRDVVRVVVEFAASGHAQEREHGVRRVLPIPVHIATSPDNTEIVVRLVERTWENGSMAPHLHTPATAHPQRARPQDNSSGT